MTEEFDALLKFDPLQTIAFAVVFFYWGSFWNRYCATLSAVQWPRISVVECHSQRTALAAAFLVHMVCGPFYLRVGC